MSRSWLRRLFSRKSSPTRKNESKTLQPLLRLEDRITPAFNTTLSVSATAGVSIVTAAGTTTYTATATGANVSLIDISTQLVAGNNVVVDSGSTGTEAGNITSAVNTSLSTTNNFTLTLQSGSGTNLVGDISIGKLSSVNPASFVAKANGSFTSSDLGFQSMDLRATKGSITATGTLSGSDLFMSAATEIGAAGTPLQVKISNLTATTTGNGAGIFITEGDNLKLAKVNAINGVEANNGNVVLTTTNGGIDMNGRQIFSGAAPITINVGGTDHTFDNTSGLVQTFNQPISITADHLVLGNLADGINPGTSAVTLQPATAGRGIDLGAVGDPNGTLSLSSAELGTITTTASLVQIGGATSGDITITSDITLPIDAKFQTGGAFGGTKDFINSAVGGTTLTLVTTTDSTYSGRIGGPSGGTATQKNIAFDYQGAGTLKLTGNSTYTGTTTVSSGTLLVNGASGSGTTTVKSGATIGGTGTVGGDLLINSGGTLSPGSGTPGTLTVGNDLTLSSGSTLLIDISGPNADQVSAKKANIGDGVNILGTVSLPLFGAAYTIINANLNVAGNGFKDVNGTNLTPNKGGPIVVSATKFNYDYTGNKFRLTAIGTAVSVDGTGNLIVTDLIDKDDTLTISRVGANIRLNDPNNALLAGAGAIQVDENTVDVPFASVTGKIQIDTGKGDDIVSLKVAGGIIPAGGISYNGGTTGTDVLAVTGSGVETAVYTPSATTTGSGTVAVDGKSISFSNLEPVDVSGMVLATVALPGANDILDVSNGFDVATGAVPALVVSGTSGGVAIEAAHFFNNTTMLIDTTVVPGNDTVTVTSADNAHKNVNLTIKTGTGTDLLDVKGSVSVTGTADLQAATMKFGAATAITAKALALAATNGIAASGTPLKTSVSNLEAQTSTGGIFISNSGDLDIGGASAALSGVQVTTSGDIDITGDKKINIQTAGEIINGPSNVKLTSSGGGDITFDIPIDGKFALTVNTGGGTNFFKTVGGTTPLASIKTDAAGLTRLSANITTTGAQDYGDQLALFGDQTITSTTNGPMTFAQIDNNFSLTINAKGSINFNGKIGSLLAIKSLTATASSPLTVAADITANNDVLLTAGETSDAPTFADKLTVNAGVTVLSNTGNVTLQAGDDVVLNNSSVIKSTAKAVTITAGFTDADGSGGISVGKWTVQAGTDATLTAVTDINVATVTAGGDATISSTAGNIFDDSDDTTVISAGKLTLSAVRSIGQPGATPDIDSKVTSVTATTTGAGPFVGAPNAGIWVTDSDDLTVTNATTTGDGVILIDAGASLDAQTVVANGTGRNVRLRALGGDLTVGSITAIGDNVALSATGKIVDGNAATNNVAAAGLSLSAGTTIASGGDPLESTVSTVAWNSGTGDFFLINTGPTTVGAVLAFGVTVTGGSGSGKAILTAASPLTVAANVIMGGDVTLTAGEKSDAPTFADVFTINAAITVQSTTGNVLLQAGDDIDLKAGAIIKSDAGSVTLTAAFGDLDTHGGITSGVATITAGTDITLTALDSIAVPAATATGKVTITSTTGAITDANGAAINVTAVDLVASAATGIDLDTQVTNITATSSGAGDVVINETDGANVVNVAATTGNATVTTTTGDLNVTTVSASGTVNLQASAGKITDANAGATNVTAANLDASSQNGIDLDTKVDTITATTSAAGSILLDEFDGVTLTNVSAANGPITITAGDAVIVTSVISVTDNDANDISITAAIGDITVATINAGATAGDVTLKATTGNILDDGVNATAITGDVLTLTAVRSIGQPGATANMDTTANSWTLSTTGAGPFAGAPTPGIWATDSDAVTATTVTTLDGFVVLGSGGTMTATLVTAGGTGRNAKLATTAGDLLIDTVTATGDSVLLQAAGAIVDNNAAGMNVTATNLEMTAGTGIGAGNSLETTVTKLAALSTTGNIEVTNTGALTVDSLTTFGVVVAGVTTASNVNLIASDQITLAAEVAGVLMTFNAAANGINQTAGKVTGTSLELLATGTVSLKSTTNNVATIAANVVGDVTYVDADDLSVGTAGGTSNITAAGKTVRLESGAGKVSGGAGTHITAASFAGVAAKDITLTTAITNIEAKSSGGNIDITNAGGLTVGAVAADLTGVTATIGHVNLTANAGTLNVASEGVSAGAEIALKGNFVALNANVAATTSVTLNSTVGGVGQTAGAVTGSGLLLLGTGTFFVDQPNNDVTTFAANVSGKIVARDKNDLTIGLVAGTDNVFTNNNDLFLRTGRSFSLVGGKSINLGTGAGEVRTGLADDGSGKASGYVNLLNGTITANMANGFAIYGGTNSNSFQVTPSVTAPIFVFGDVPTQAQVSLPLIPGDDLATATVPNAVVGSFVINAMTNKRAFTYTDKNTNLEIRRPIIFENIENIKGLSAQVFSVQTAADKYQVVANATLNSQPIVGGFTGTLPPSAPFLAAPQFINPNGPFTAPRIALGDINGDNIQDLIIGFGGNSGSPLVTVVDGKRIVDSSFAVTSALQSKDILAQFYAYDPKFQGGVYVATADFNGDGRSEIITGTGSGGGPDVKVFQYVPGQTLDKNINVLTEFFAYEPNFLGGVRVAAGDVNGDGKPDIVTAPGAGHSPLIKVFNGHTLNPTGAASPMNQFMAYNAGFTGGVFLDVGRYTPTGGAPDNFADIVTGAGFGGGPHVRVFDGKSLPTDGSLAASTLEFFNDPPGSGGVADQTALTAGVSSVAFADVNGDGRLDIFVGTGVSRRTRMRAYLNGMGTPEFDGPDEKDYLNLKKANPGPFDLRLDGAFAAISVDNI